MNTEDLVAGAFRCNAGSTDALAEAARAGESVPTSTPMGLLLCAMPLVGHVTPLLPLARELVGRGHTVHFYTGARFREQVENTGAQFETMSDALDPGKRPLESFLPELRELTGIAQLKYALKRFFIDSGHGQVSDLRRIVPRVQPHALVVDSSFRGAALLHELGEGPPWVAVNIFPLMLSSRDTAPFGPGFLPMPGRLGRLRNAVLQELAARILMRDVVLHANAQRATLGLPPRTELVFDAALSPFLYLQAGVASLEYPRSDLAPQVHFVGPMTDPPSGDPQDLPPWWEDLVSSDRPVIHITQGTANTDPEELLIPALRALADENVLVVATTGGPGIDTLGPLPANARAAQFIPHAALLPHIGVMVTNGGYGGVLRALAHGIPLVVAGATQDKPEVANRVQFARAGVNLRTGTPTQAAIRQAVRRVLTDPSFRRGAQAIADDIARHRGARAAADLIGSLVATGRPVHRSPAVTSDPVPDQHPRRGTRKRAIRQAARRQAGGASR
ncbi:glycosyltransferase [Geodermatophilus poikilotrophus]|uniref:Glycosyltransferase, MGT family n=1 Tax=Geodermatophilus poikilotrophus TaxID=1333667 RepID=A0A1H9YEK3_9ACTN|nr:nucleotide disphospho-sugar-binding domain-containing protein [Geodermatophilus poikilotrophus]SES67348.1 glycosyltransferase, MGT family [Geodermatophilus poikilotrophus]